ncbi:hypothetical protein PN836_004205 [Ningiella sp. W23]|uniref:hypothetical protein n=1 Tax=Ningiella sp. W23 TaxID=3023715 RepID=UPI0037577AF6
MSLNFLNIQTRRVICSVADAMDMCFQDPSVDYRFYWRNKSGSKPEHAMLFFLEDGNAYILNYEDYH